MSLKLKSLFFLFSLFLFFSCAHNFNKNGNPLEDSDENKMSHGEQGLYPPTSPPELTIGIPEDHPLVQKWITYFTTKDRERFQRFLDRGISYKDVVQTILKENGLPTEIYYLALIESGYSTHAKSRAKAVGAWQFMKGTAKNYQLQVDSYIDERRDPIRATEAASRYLNDLYREFQNWELALASYNCGENRIRRLIKTHETKDYWQLIERRGLPRETKNYVPKFMAAILIGENPEYYGFTVPSLDNIYPSLEAVEVPSPINLEKIAELSSVSIDDIKFVNPHIQKGITTPYSATYELWIPQQHIPLVKNILPSLEQHRLKQVDLPKERPQMIRGPDQYTVRKGDNLGSIAQKFGISVNYLKRINALKSNKIYARQKLRVTSKSYDRNAVSADMYVVSSGDSLNSIAEKYHTTVDMLKELNHLTSTKIFPGQKLKVDFNKSEKSLYHYVKSRENLSTIARKYRISLTKLKSINQLKDSRIYKGQKLKIN